MGLQSLRLPFGQPPPFTQGRLRRGAYLRCLLIFSAVFAEKGGVSVGGAAVGADPGVFRRGQIFHLGGDHVLVQDPLCNLRANTVKEGVYFDPPFQRPFFTPETA